MTAPPADAHQPAPDATAWGTPGATPDASLTSCVTFDDIRAAADLLSGVAVRTPVIEHPALNDRVGSRVLLKCENFQRVGAFKFRGAFHAISRLSDAERAAGVLTFSSGNHAQAVARSAEMLGVKAVIVMPVDAPRVKLDATRRYLEGAPAGSRVVTYEPASEVREEIGAELASGEGLTIVPPYDHPDVIAGQGTAALELFEDHGGMDHIYVCTGGGGLLSGSAIIAKVMSPGVRVVGAEPALADDAARSFADGKLHVVSGSRTIADGARTPYLGRHTFPLILRHVDAFVTVSEAEISRALAFALSTLKIVAEPSGVLGLAALLKDADDGLVTPGSTVGVIVSGGNVDIEKLPALLAIGE
jgi:threonine dehydratase